MLTPEQIGENNRAAKEWLAEFIPELRKYQEKKAEHKKMPIGTAILYHFCNQQELLQDMHVRYAFQSAVQDLKFYFKMYYKYGEWYACRYSPVLAVRVRKGYGYVTKVIKEAPHPVYEN